MKTLKLNTIAFLCVFLELIAVVLSVGFDEACTPGNQDDCDKNLDLICSKDTELCTCRETFVYVDDIAGCRVRANEFCKNSDKCVPYADCELRRGESELKCWCKSSKSDSPPSDFCPKMSYEESCTEDDVAPCDPAKFLQCSSDKICECQNKNESIFDDVEQNKCRLKVEAVCDDDPSHVAEDCVKNALCYRKKCVCSSDIFEVNPDRQCTVPYGEACDAVDKTCYENGYQDCVSGKCTCLNKDDTYFDNKTRSCYLLSGRNCSPRHQECAPNSFCNETLQKCQCNEDLHPNDIGRCVLGYDSRCDVSNSLCDESKFLECDAEEGKCACKLATETIFNVTTEKCDLLANAPCNPFGQQQCIDEAHCDIPDGGDTFQCTCIGSQKPNKNRKCFLPFNVTCDETNNKCDPDGFLSCNPQDHNCICERTDMEYIGSEKSCRILPGGSCSNFGFGNPECGLNSNCDGANCVCDRGYEFTGRATCLKVYGQNCIAALDDCNIYKNVHCINGICGCEAGNIPGTTVNGTHCYAGYHHLCSQEIDCYAQGYLACTAGRCECLSPSEQIFNTTNQKCLSVPGKRCNLNAAPSDIALHCVDNAVCVRNEDTLYGACKCSPPYEPDLDSQQCIIYGSVSANLSSWSFILFCIVSHLFLMN